MRGNVYFLLVLSFVISVSAMAQQTVLGLEGKITGKIVDSTTGAPIEFASVVISAGDSNTQINAVSTDEKGYFALSGIAPGAYKLTVFFEGYKPFSIKKIIIKPSRLNIALGNVKLSSATSSLAAVTVSADKEAIENTPDKIVFNVAKDITAQTGVATDVLKKIPEVSVDIDGNIELQGNSDIRFLIDGKPSTIFGTNINEVLQTIPASEIEKIEVITNPGAKYDAEGTGGIINIILKKSKIRGVNGSFSLSAGTRMENGGANINARSGNFGVYGYFGGNATLLSNTPTSLMRKGSDTASTTLNLTQNGSGTLTRQGYWTGAGFDWEATKHDNLYGGVNYNQSAGATDAVTSQQTILDDMNGNVLSDINALLNSSTNYDQHTMGGYMNYKRTFARKDQELDVDCNTSITSTSQYYAQSQEYVASGMIYDGSNGSNPGTSGGTNLSVDYKQPVDSDITVETGAKATINRIQSSSNVYLLNTLTENYGYSSTESNELNYNQDIFAAYISTSFKLFKLIDVKPGLRDEYTTTGAWFSNSGLADIPYYNTLVPSLGLLRNFNGHQSLRLNYSYRIQRPNYNQLDPFVNTFNPENITTGNPDLQPEIGEKVEMGYNKIFENGTNLFLTMFYAENLHDIQPYATYYSLYTVGDSVNNNVVVNEPENIGKEENIGFSFYGLFPATQKIKIRPYGQFFQRYIYTGLSTGGNISGFNYRLNLNGSYEISDKLALEIFGNYNSIRINAEGTYPAFFQYNCAIRLYLFHKKGSIAITATDPFNYYTPQVTNLAGEGFTLVSERDVPYQSFGINFTCRLGKMEFKDDEPHNGANPDESNSN